MTKSMAEEVDIVHCVVIAWPWHLALIISSGSEPGGGAEFKLAVEIG